MFRPIIIWAWLLSPLTYAQQTGSAEQHLPVNQAAEAENAGQSPQQDQTVDTRILQELGNDYQNSIRLLQNRFRIDYHVDEITLVFFRKYGSRPVVLVRPDGSKIFQQDADGEQIFWYDDAQYDLINIKDPEPGPWQAVGQLLPESRVMVLSDIQLHVDPLPDVLFSGEILKQRGYLTNNGKPIEFKDFREVVSLSLKFVSTNNPNFDNFGADEQIIANFEDNGRGMDGRPRDGVFTGQFNLSVAPGEWQPVFLVTTPMYTREQQGDPIVLYPNPIRIAVAQPDDGEEGARSLQQDNDETKIVRVPASDNEFHTLQIDVNRELVDINSLLVDGKVRFPNGDVQNFSLTEPSAAAREYEIVNFESGIYRIKLTAFGTTLDGRDFIIDVPEYTFLAESPPPPEAVQKSNPELADKQDEQPTVPDIENQLPVAEINDVKEEMSTALVATIAIAVNGVLLIGGGIAIWWFLKGAPRKKAPSTESEKKASQQTQSDNDPAPSWLEKFTEKLPFKKNRKQADSD